MTTPRPRHDYDYDYDYEHLANQPSFYRPVLSVGQAEQPCHPGA